MNMTQNDEGNMLAPMWLFDHVAACIRDGKATEEMARNVECLRGGMEAQAARIAELETKLQAVLRREADANRAAFAHMRRITALEAKGIAARKATAKNYARAEAAAPKVKALVDAAKEAVEALDYSVSEIADLENTLSNYRQNWQPAAAALSVLRAALAALEEQ